jgi:hypothetical protein
MSKGDVKGYYQECRIDFQSDRYLIARSTASPRLFSLLHVAHFETVGCLQDETPSTTWHQFFVLSRSRSYLSTGIYIYY